jgi:hypothetical protein
VPPTAAALRAALLRLPAPTGAAARIASLLRTGGYALAFTAPASGHITISWYSLPKGAGLATAKPKPILVATGQGNVSAGARARVLIRVTARGKALLRHASRLKLTARGVLSPAGGTPLAVSSTFVLTR